MNNKYTQRVGNKNDLFYNSPLNLFHCLREICQGQLPKRVFVPFMILPCLAVLCEFPSRLLGMADTLVFGDLPHNSSKVMLANIVFSRESKGDSVVSFSLHAALCEYEHLNLSPTLH